MVRPMIITNPILAVTRPFNAGPFSRLAAFSGLEETAHQESATRIPAESPIPNSPLIRLAAKVRAVATATPALG